MQEVQTEVVEDTITQIDSEVVEVSATGGKEVEVEEVKDKLDYDKILAEQEETLQRLKELEKQNGVMAKQIEADLKAKQSQELNNALNDANLIVFKGFENIGELPINKQVEFIQKAVNEILIQHSYQPKDVAQQDAYAEALQQGDVKKAIDFKFSRLFGKK